MKPRIKSLGFAVPDKSYTQEEVWDLLGYKNRRTKSIFLNSGIDKRHLWVEPTKKSWQELCDAYFEGALSLSKKSSAQCLQGWNIDNVGLLVFCSVSGYQCPSMSYWIARDMGLRHDISHCNILGQGCEAAVPGLRRAYEFVQATGEDALVIATEVCSASYYPAPENDLENTVSNAIFGDGSSAALVGYESDLNPDHPMIIGFQSLYSPEHIQLLGYQWKDGRLKVVLDKDVPKIVPPLVRQAVERVLATNSVTKEEIVHWILHPGGVKVLEALEHELGLERKQTQNTWEVMRQYGNCSSATVGIIAKAARQSGLQGHMVVASMGAGTEVSVALLKGG